MAVQRPLWRKPCCCFLLLAAVFAIWVLAVNGLSIPTAEAGYEWLGPVQGEFATQQLEGDLGGISNVAVNDKTGDVYVADGINHRMTRFNEKGEFLGASGWNVIAMGPDKAGVDQVELIVIKGTGGKFELEYGELTEELASNAPASVVESALNSLNNIRTDSGAVKDGGKVKVQGGPGDETGSKPYILTYEGALGDEEQLHIRPVDDSLAGGSPTSSVEQKIVTEGVPAFEDCLLANGDVCKQHVPRAEGEGSGNLRIPKAIAVDQGTGDVYVFDPERAKGRVQILSAEGKFISSFGEEGVVEGGIAVDATGNVFVTGGGRIKIFRPESPGDYEHYVYAGESHDIPVDAGAIAVDASDNIYTYIGNSRVVRISPVNLSALMWEGSADCESEAYNGLEALTVNAISGDVFIYGENPSEGKKKLYKLSPTQCATTQKFSQTEAIAPASGESFVEGLAYNPNVGLEADGGGTRPLGTLYAVYPGGPEHSGLIFGQSSIFPPAVVSEEVSNVGVKSATLDAVIDPHGNVTRYAFQYSLASISECETSDNCMEAPVGEGSLEASENNAVASTTVALLPGTTYHFRVVASSHCNPDDPAEVCQTKGPDREFRTFSSSAPVPPDGRAYELVSPLLKNGGEVFPASSFAANCDECLPGANNEHFPMQSTPDGNHIVYEGDAFAPAGEAVNENEYLASRTTTGWGTDDLSPTLQSKGEGQGFKGFSSDLSRGVLFQIEPGLSPGALSADGLFYPNLYLREGGGSGDPTPLLTSESVSGVLHRAPGGNVPEGLKLSFEGASSDYGHIVFAANDTLTSDAPLVTNEDNLYDWTGGHLQLVNVRPNGQSDPGAVLGSGHELSGEDPDYSHAVSTDGSRIFWTDQQNGQVYVREGNETSIVPDAGRFLTASADGSKVLLSDGRLYDLDTGELTDVTSGHGGFQGILGAGEDLSKIFFVDTEVLTKEENAEKVEASEGADNLYAWHEGVTTFVGTLAPGDNSDHLVGLIFDTGDWRASPADRTAQATPDGRYLTFMSAQSLTGYENTVTSGECGTNRGKSCYEVFEYNSVANQLSCMSCNPTGERPLGSSILNLINPGSGPLPQPLSVLEDGRVFFDSLDTLSPQDKNGTVEDVYEHEPDGVGSCAQIGGCVLLISSGEGESDSDFVNVTPSGSDVFFTTRSQLVTQDKDDLIDLYDAREPHAPGEQVFFPPEASLQECSSGEECRPDVAGPPNLTTPLSATLSGPGNLVASPPAPPPALPTVKPPPTKAQLLAKALKACQKLRSKKKRATCTAKAKKRYATKANAKTNAGANNRKSRTTKK